MLNLLDQTTKCLQIPYFILFVFVCALLLFFKKKFFFILLFLLIFMISWRLCFRINSSRYCISFLLILYLGLAILFPIVQKRFMINVPVLVIIMGLLFYNSIKLFSGFRNLYQLDLADDVRCILSNSENNCIFIQEKEFFRLGVAESSLSSRQISMRTLPMSYESLTPFYDLYDYIRKDSYVVLSGKGKESEPHISIPDNSHSTFSEIRHYCSNKKTSFESIYYHPQTTPDLLRLTNEINNPEIKDIVEKGLLKAYEPISDTYVFQLDHDLIWLIGTEIVVGTEIVYHLHTNSPELLPSQRIIHGFDNRGILVRNSNDLKFIGNYIVFKKEIPDDYPITTVRVGFYNSKSKTNIWSRTFQL